MDFVTVIKEFMKSMVVFAVLSAFCIHLLPDQRYQKYARFIIGLVYICMIMDLIGNLLGKSMPVIAF